jgi:peptide/nickel transport system substrate-binding protein
MNRILRGDRKRGKGLKKWEISRRQFIKSIGVAGGSVFIGDFLRGPAFSQQKSGEPIETLEVVTHTANYNVEGMRLIVEQWKKLGLEVRFTPMLSSALIPKVYKRDFKHLAYVTWGANPERYDPGFWFTELYHSANAKPGGRNWGDYVNPKLDVILDQQDQEQNIEKRRDLIWKAQAVAAEDHPIWYTVYQGICSVYNTRKWKGWVNMIGSPPTKPYAPWNIISIEPTTEQRILRWGSSYDINSRNPFTQTTGVSQAFVRFIYDRFFQISLDLKVVPWAAESWKWVDKTTLDIRIRKGMKFHDGKPVTPEDAAFSFEYFLKYNIPRYGTVTKNLKGVKLLDNGDVRLFLKTPSVSYIGSALVWAHLIPKHIWEKVDKPMEFEDPKMIGSGLFALKEWKRGEVYFFTSNPHHFASPKMDGFYWILIPALETQLGMLESGEIDIIGEDMAFSQAREVAKHPDIDYMVTENIAFDELRPRVQVKPFDDVEFRKALHHAIPKREILQVAREGVGVVGHNTPITPKNQYWHNSGIPFVDFDIEKAKRILEKAGYFRNKEGRLCFPKK